MRAGSSHDAKVVGLDFAHGIDASPFA